MRLLIADLLRRKNRWLVVFATAFLAITWGWLPEMGDPARAFAISMGAAFALGPQTSLWFMPREIWYLPIAGRDVWRASWLVATVGTTALTLAPKVLTLLRPAVRDTVGVSGVLLST